MNINVPSTAFDAFIAGTWKGGADPDGKNYERDLTIAGLGLTGEAGESVEHIKKYFRDGTPLGPDFKLELGDVLYYVVKNAHLQGWTLGDLMVALSEKLNKRRVKKGQDEVPLLYRRTK